MRWALRPVEHNVNAPAAAENEHTLKAAEPEASDANVTMGHSAGPRQNVNGDVYEVRMESAPLGENTHKPSAEAERLGDIETAQSEAASTSRPQVRSLRERLWLSYRRQTLQVDASLQADDREVNAAHDALSERSTLNAMKTSEPCTTDGASKNPRKTEAVASARKNAGDPKGNERRETKKRKSSGDDKEHAASRVVRRRRVSPPPEAGVSGSSMLMTLAEIVTLTLALATQADGVYQESAAVVWGRRERRAPASVTCTFHVFGEHCVCSELRTRVADTCGPFSGRLGERRV